MVEIERISPLTGNWNKIYVDITQEQIVTEIMDMVVVP